MADTLGELEQLRERALQLLRAERREIHSGELAMLLQVPTHQILSALEQPMRRGKAWFSSSGGWSVPPDDNVRAVDERQTRIE